MKKYLKYLVLAILLITIPTLVYASGSNGTVGGAIGMMIALSLHSTAFLMWPLASLITKEGESVGRNIVKLVIARIVILILGIILISPNIINFDVASIFLGGFILLPIAASKGKLGSKGGKITVTRNGVTTPVGTNTNNQVIVLKCSKCGGVMKVDDKFCTTCGAKFEGDNVVVTTEQKVFVKPSDFDPIYSKTDEQLLEEFIKKELTKAQLEPKSKLIPEEILKRKKVFSVIFSVLLFVYICLIFFHFPIATYAIGAIILLIFKIVSTRYNFMKYLKKEIKSRPTEKISNIVMNAKESLVEDNSKAISLITACISIIVPLIIFTNPVILYEKCEGGYAVRFYAFGLKKFKTATIPDRHNNKPIVSLRGNTFSNMPFLESVTLPYTITEIRGQAFKNDVSLKEVALPPKLKYLGGGAFYNCTSLIGIVIPDTVTEMGGETFYGATSLQTVKLSNSLTEIRGDSFEYCTSLKEITIPDSVRRIGGHAFYGDTSLSKVNIGPKSQLEEIGSSAFRQCYNLYEITVPSRVFINERAFKESPTSVKFYDGN